MTANHKATPCVIGSNSDVGKILLPTVATLYSENLGYHRHVLMQSLGVKAGYDVAFTAAKGDGAENCFTPFRGYWAGSQAERFNGQNLKLVLGISELELRGILMLAKHTKSTKRQLPKTSSTVRTYRTPRA